MITHKPHILPATAYGDQIAPMPPPQAQKRGPPATSHPAESPAKRQSKWSAEENATITRLRGEGMKWEDISQHLPGRSAISCRLHYQNFLERKAEWDEEKKNKLARLYDRFKKDMWDPVAKELGMPWRAVEAMHWELGNEGIAARTGVPVFATASATATEPQSIPPVLAAAHVPTLSQVLKYSNPSPPKSDAELHSIHGRSAPMPGLQPMPPSTMAQGGQLYAGYPPPPHIPSEPPSSRPRRSASSTPVSRQRSSSHRRGAAGNRRVESVSPGTASVPLPADRPPTTLPPPSQQNSEYHHHLQAFIPTQMVEVGRLPPMRYLTEPTPSEQTLEPMAYRRPSGPDPHEVPPSVSEMESSAGSRTDSGGGDGGERRRYP